MNGNSRWFVDVDPRGWQRSPLVAAVTGGHLDAARWLLEEGGEVDRPTKYGDTALSCRKGEGAARRPVKVA